MDVLVLKVRLADLSLAELEALEPEEMTAALVCPELKEMGVWLEPQEPPEKMVCLADLVKMDALACQEPKETQVTPAHRVLLDPLGPREEKETLEPLGCLVVMVDLETWVLLELKEMLVLLASALLVPRETWADLETLDFLGDKASVERLARTDFLEQQAPPEPRETAELLVVLAETELLVAEEKRGTLRP
jgi:hypothetical protein